MRFPGQAGALKLAPIIHPFLLFMFICHAYVVKIAACLKNDMEIKKDNRGHISRVKAALLIALVGLVVGSVVFLATPARQWVTGLFHAGAGVSPANSNAAMFGYDLQHTHFDAGEHLLNTGNVNRLVLDWTLSTSAFIISTPAVTGGVVYVGSNDQSFYALDARTGKTLWFHVAKADIGSSPAVANGIVYVGSSDHKLYAFNARTGKVVWTYMTGNAIWSSPAVANSMPWTPRRERAYGVTPLITLSHPRPP